MPEKKVSEYTCRPEDHRHRPQARDGDAGFQVITRHKMMFGTCVVLGLCLTGATPSAAQSDRVGSWPLADRGNGIVHPCCGGQWGIEIAGSSAPRIRQPKPARLEVFRTEQDILQLAAGYKTVQKTADGIDAKADIPYGEKVVFHVEDQLEPERLGALAAAESGSNRDTRRAASIRPCCSRSIPRWLDRRELPGAGHLVWRPHLRWQPLARRHDELRGPPLHDARGHPPGAACSRFPSANGASVAVLDPAPRGDTTVAGDAGSPRP